MTVPYQLTDAELRLNEILTGLKFKKILWGDIHGNPPTDTCVCGYRCTDDDKYDEFAIIPWGELQTAIKTAADQIEMQQRERVEKRPRIVCLCGSTRFKDAFDEANYQETMAGKIVLSVGFYMHATDNQHGGHIGATPEQKIALDELHKRKIDLADEVLILNVGGYIGESTQSELDYATESGKIIRYLEAAIKELEAEGEEDVLPFPEAFNVDGSR